MMEGVINNGLGYTAVRLRGFTLPAAGRLEFARRLVRRIHLQFCSALFWVGYDDYSDLRITGAMPPRPSGPSS